MEITPIDAELSAKVFQNPNLMDNILNNMKAGLMQNVYLRLVSKIFNVAYIAIIQKNHSTIKVEYRGEPRVDSSISGRMGVERTAEQKLEDIEEKKKNQLEDAKINLYINYRSVNIEKIDGYFRFLTSLNLTLDTIIFVNLSKLRSWSREILHNSIIDNYVALKIDSLNTFIGGSDICARCEVCERIAMNTQEYGPMNASVLWSMRNPKHFKKLIICDRILDFHSNKGAFFTREKFFQQILPEFLNSRISCGTLIIQVSQLLFTNYFNNNAEENGQRFEHNSIPREVLKWLIEKWKVKFLKLEVSRTTKYMIFEEHWTTSGFITKLSLTNPPDSEEYKEKLQPALEHVHLDFAEASFLSVSVSEHKPAWKCILGNVQNIFSTNHFKISLSPMSHHTPELIQEVLECVLKMVSEKHEKKFMIDVRYNMKLEEFSVCDDISSIWQSIQTSSYSYKFTKSTLNEQCKKRYSNEMNPYNNGERIVKKFKLENIRNNWTINFEVWIIN